MKKTETFASIFGDDYEEAPSSKDEGVMTLKLEQLVPFLNHPFKLYEGERLNEMVESIKNYGVIVPIVVRKKGLKYEILSGHNRVNAAKLAGLIDVPSVIKEGLTEEEAILIVTETNLMQRSFNDLEHSERATVIATRHSAIKSQGVRTDLLNEIEKLSKAPNLSSEDTSCPLGMKLDTKKEIGADYNLSSRSVARYLKGDYLREVVLNGEVHINVGKFKSDKLALELRNLTKELQKSIEKGVDEDIKQCILESHLMLKEILTLVIPEKNELLSEKQ